MKDAPKALKMEDLDQLSDAFQIDSYIKEKTSYMLKMSGVHQWKH